MQYVKTCKRDLLPSFFCILFIVFYLFLVNFLVSSFNGNSLRSFVYVITCCAGAGEALGCPFQTLKTGTFFCSKMKRTRSLKGEMDGKLFFFQAGLGIFSAVNNMIKTLFSICTLNWRVNNYVPCQRRGINKRNENTALNMYKF